MDNHQGDQHDLKHGWKEVTRTRNRKRKNISSLAVILRINQISFSFNRLFALTTNGDNEDDLNDSPENETSAAAVRPLNSIPIKLRVKELSV